MLNSLLKTRQNRLGRMRAFVQRHGKHVRLLPPARAGIGHAAHDQRRRHHGNAEGILTLTAGFQLVGHVLNDCHRVTLSGLTTFYHIQMGAEFQILSYLCSVLRT